MTDLPPNKAAARTALFAAEAAQFYLLTARETGGRGDVEKARDHLSRAVAALDAALVEQPAQTEGAPV